MKEQPPFCIEMVDLEEFGFDVRKVTEVLINRLKIEDLEFRRTSRKGDNSMRGEKINFVRINGDILWFILRIVVIGKGAYSKEESQKSINTVI